MSTGWREKTLEHLVPVLFLLFSGVVYGQSKIAADLRREDPRAMVNVIVQFRNTPTEQHHQKIVGRGGALRASFNAIRSGSYSIPAGALGALERDPEVVHISADHAVHGLLDLTADATNASSAWNSGLTGKGIGVAIIDSGISSHPDLDSRVVFNQDLVGGGTNDLFGHGEHVAGIVAGSGKSSLCKNCTRTFKGIAPQANLINLRVLDKNGSGTDTGVIAAILETIALKPLFNIRVINLSLGRPVYESYLLDPLCLAVEAAWKAGIVVVVAAGNDGRDNSAGTFGYGTINSPGNDPYVITVGAMKTMGTPNRSDDLIATYSSKGPTMVDHIVKPDLVAPGNLVDSLLSRDSQFSQTYPQNVVPVSAYESANDPNASKLYFTLSGTSMATPVVSGAAADLLQAQPGLTPDQVKAKMMLTAYKTFPASSSAVEPTTGVVYTDEYDIFTVGAGYLDIAALLTDQSLPHGSAMSPTASYDAASGSVYLTTLLSAVWNSQSLWGSRAVWHTSAPNALEAVWGGTLLDDTGAVWGTRAVWKTDTTTGFAVLWGSSSVWSASSGDTPGSATLAISGEK